MESLISISQERERESFISCNKCKTKQRKVAWHLFDYFIHSLRESILERAKHKREYDSRRNERQMQSKEGKIDSSKALDADLVVTEISGT
nr:hypothetical protein [Tanacetum cinerariifolium]